MQCFNVFVQGRVSDLVTEQRLAFPVNIQINLIYNTLDFFAIFLISFLYFPFCILILIRKKIEIPTRNQKIK